MPQLIKRGQLTCIDINQKFLKETKKKFPQVECHCMPIEKISFSDASFDEVNCADVLEHVDDLDQAVSEIGRVAKKGCRLTIEVPEKLSEEFLLKLNPSYFEEVGHKRKIDLEELISLLKANGFSLEETRFQGFIDNLFTGFNFLNGRKIMDQSGALSEEDKLSQKEKLMLYLWLATKYDEQEAGRVVGENLAQSLAKAVGKKEKEIKRISREFDKIGSQIFPKTICLELKKE